MTALPSADTSKPFLSEQAALPLMQINNHQAFKQPSSDCHENGLQITANLSKLTRAMPPPATLKAGWSLALWH
jgi:hypothetical protein